MSNLAPGPAVDFSELPRKLRLLLSSAETQGRDVRFGSIARFLDGQGISMTSEEWTQLLSGASATPDPRMLEGLCSFFGVPVRYLTDDKDLTARVEAQLNLLEALRRNKVRSFAVRQMNDVTADTIQRIQLLLDEAGEEPVPA